MHAFARTGSWSLAVAATVLAIQLAAPRSTVDPPGRLDLVMVLTSSEKTVVTAPIVEPPPKPIVIPSTYGECKPLDFDGDGVIDRYEAVHDSCGTGGCVYDVYFTRPGKDDRFVGQIEGLCPFFVLRRQAHGPSDIFATWRLGAVESSLTHYRFFTASYRPVHHQTCIRGECKPSPIPR
jgi:hypothetical protein